MTDPTVEERCISVSTFASADGHELAIADSRLGIPSAMLARVAEPFCTKSFSTGLGLPTVKEIVEHHGGVVEIVSHLGTGLQVVVRLPNSVTEKLVA